MVKLKSSEWDLIKGWFCPSPGYLLDFSNRTFSDFFEDEFSINIYADSFSGYGTSKFSRFRAFIEASPPHVVIQALRFLWDRRNADRDVNLERLQRNPELYTASEEYIEHVFDAAAEEDRPFEKLMERLESLQNEVPLSAFHIVAKEWTLDTVNRDIERALTNIEADPEAAVTAASSMIESICSSIVVVRGEALPRTKDIQSLFKEAQRILDLSPKREILDKNIENDVKMILSGVTGAVQGIGALRTHGGSAHGRQRGFRRIDPRIARFSVNVACGICLFLVETWEKRFPEDRLMFVNGLQDGAQQA